MKLTREQVNKINSKCENGWCLDVQHTLMTGEKALTKTLEIDDKTVIKYTLMWQGYNATRWERTTQFYPCVHFAKWRKSTGGSEFWHSNGLGDFPAAASLLGEDTALYTRKTIAELQKLTSRLTQEVLDRYEF